MAPEESPDPEELLAEARKRQSECLGTLLELYRNYLLLLARTQIDLHLRGRVDASDLVQETFLDACRDFSRFRGSSERELLAWLRQILVCNVARAVQTQLVAKKRDARRDVSLDCLRDLEQSAARFEAVLISPQSTPSNQALRRERVALIADHLARLPADHREVIVLRNLEGLPFAEVAKRMGRSSGAVRVLWVRALDQFRRLLDEEELR